MDQKILQKAMTIPYFRNISLQTMKIYPVAIYLGCICLLSCCNTKKADKSNPNIIYILADDLGYGDVSCFNPRSKIKTTHIDRLASEGMIFTDAHSGSSVCTPTRYGILTGRYSWRSTLKEGVTWTNDPHIIPSSRLTVASMLKENNYNTACIGKWHLGFDWQVDSLGNMIWDKPIANGPTSLGFDYFYGIKASLDIPPYFYIENDRITASTIDSIDYSPPPTKFWREGPIGNDFVMEEVLPQFMNKAIEYITKQASENNPFFLYLPLPAPHTPIIPTQEFIGKSNTNTYGDFVLMVDHVVGQVMQSLEEIGQTENTIFIFTDDNGCSPNAGFEELGRLGHDPSFTFRGHKADIYEGGNRVPFVVRWPKKIKANTRSDEIMCLTDFMATIANIIDYQLPENAGEDSYDFSSLLSGAPYKTPLREATIHHSVNGSFAIRQNEWKLILCPGSGGWSHPVPKIAFENNLPPVQLYNLKDDIEESKNLEAIFPDKVNELTDLAQSYIDRGRSTPGPNQHNEGETLLFYQREKRNK